MAVVQLERLVARAGFIEELLTAAWLRHLIPGAVQNQHRIAHHAVRILARRAEAAVVNAQLRQRFAGGEAEALVG